MHVLVAVASKHGGTAGIADAIAEGLRAAGASADVVRLEENVSVDWTKYDAAVIGSAVYLSAWMGLAKDFVRDNEAALRDIPVWLFSSGLADVPAVDANSVPDRLKDLAELHARGHRHFSGRLELGELSIPERAVIAAARGKYGDARDLAGARAWGESIGQKLLA